MADVDFSIGVSLLEESNESKQIRKRIDSILSSMNKFGGETSKIQDRADRATGGFRQSIVDSSGKVVSANQDQIDAFSMNQKSLMGLRSELGQTSGTQAKWTKQVKETTDSGGSLTSTITDMNKVGGKWEKTAQRVEKRTKNFRMEFLSTLFAGMQLQKTFGGLTMAMEKQLGASDALAESFGVFLLPGLEKFADLNFRIADGLQEIGDSPGIRVGGFQIFSGEQIGLISAITIKLLGLLGGLLFFGSQIGLVSKFFFPVLKEFLSKIPLIGKAFKNSGVEARKTQESAEASLQEFSKGSDKATTGLGKMEKQNKDVNSTIVAQTKQQKKLAKQNKKTSKSTVRGAKASSIAIAGTVAATAGLLVGIPLIGSLFERNFLGISTFFESALSDIEEAFDDSIGLLEAAVEDPLNPAAVIPFTDAVEEALEPLSLVQSLIGAIFGSFDIPLPDFGALDDLFNNEFGISGPLNTALIAFKTVFSNIWTDIKNDHPWTKVTSAIFTRFGDMKKKLIEIVTSGGVSLFGEGGVLTKWKDNAISRLIELKDAFVEQFTNLIDKIKQLLEEGESLPEFIERKFGSGAETTTEAQGNIPPITTTIPTSEGQGIFSKLANLGLSDLLRAFGVQFSVDPSSQPLGSPFVGRGADSPQQITIILQAGAIVTGAENAEQLTNAILTDENVVTETSTSTQA